MVNLKSKKQNRNQNRNQNQNENKNGNQSKNRNQNQNQNWKKLMPVCSVILRLERPRLWRITQHSLHSEGSMYVCANIYRY